MENLLRVSKQMEKRLIVCEQLLFGGQVCDEILKADSGTQPQARIDALKSACEQLTYAEWLSTSLCLWFGEILRQDEFTDGV